MARKRQLGFCRAHADRRNEAALGESKDSDMATATDIGRRTMVLCWGHRCATHRVRGASAVATRSEGESESAERRERRGPRILPGGSSPIHPRTGHPSSAAAPPAWPASCTMATAPRPPAPSASPLRPRLLHARAGSGRRRVRSKSLPQSGGFSPAKLRAMLRGLEKHQRNNGEDTSPEANDSGELDDRSKSIA